MSISLSKIDSFAENIVKKVIDLSGTLTVALTNTAHTASWDELADLTQISYTNLSSRDITVTSCSQIGGTLTVILQDLTMTASGAVGPFQYIYVYDDKSTEDKLCWYYDYGSALTLASGDTFKIDWDNTLGAITLK